MPQVTSKCRTSERCFSVTCSFKPSIVRVIKSRRMRWASHVARMEEGRGVHKVLVEKPEGRDHWGDQDVDGRIILRLIFRKWEGVVGTGWGWLRIGTGGGRLWGRWWTFGFRKMRGISWLAAKPVSCSRRTLLHGVSKYFQTKILWRVLCIPSQSWFISFWQLKYTTPVAPAFRLGSSSMLCVFVLLRNSWYNDFPVILWP